MYNVHLTMLHSQLMQLLSAIQVHLLHTHHLSPAQGEIYLTAHSLPVHFHLVIDHLSPLPNPVQSPLLPLPLLQITDLPTTDSHEYLPTISP